MPTILLVGADQTLLRTRAAVLRKTGCNTVCATANSALLLQEEYRCEIIVLCHTVPDTVGVALLRVLRERWPQTRILQIVPQQELQTRSAAALADAVSYADPTRLVLRANELLERTKGLHRAALMVRPSTYLH